MGLIRIRTGFQNSVREVTGGLQRVARSFMWFKEASKRVSRSFQEVSYGLGRFSGSFKGLMECFRGSLEF